MEMENQKKKSHVLLYIVIGLFIGILLSFAIGYVLYSQEILKFQSTKAAVKESNNQKSNETPLKSEEINYIFDSNKVSNALAEGYALTVPSHAVGTNVNVDSSQTKVTISINHYLVSQNYGLGWVTSSEDYNYEPHEIVFDQKVVDIFFGGIGQDASGDTILFLMEDGTVQYLPLKKAYSTDHENLKSYGTLSGISNIVKFYSADALAQMGGGVTILAQDRNGNLYDLSSVLQQTGNY